jgi:hypothetical protein
MGRKKIYLTEEERLEARRLYAREKYRSAHPNFKPRTSLKGIDEETKTQIKREYHRQYMRDRIGVQIERKQNTYVISIPKVKES